MIKEERISVRLDAHTSLELKNLCNTYNVPLSTMIRTLLIKSLDEARNKTLQSSKSTKV